MINEKYSRKDFTGKCFTHLDKSEFSNTTIIGSCFSQEDTDGNEVDIFPTGTNNINFERCNLDNVKIPGGSTLDGMCCNRRFKTQKDGFDWIIDKNTKKPLKPVNEKLFEMHNWSKNPNEIYDAKGHVRKGSQK